MQLYIYKKENVCITKESKSQRIGLRYQHGRRFIVLEHQYGRSDVMWKRSILKLYTLLRGFSYQRNQEFDYWVSRRQCYHTARKVHLFCTADFRYYTSQCRNYCHQTSCMFWCHRQALLDRNTSALWQGYHIYKKLSNIFCLPIT